MREMKNSGAEWVDDLPPDWEALRLKYLFVTGRNGLRIGPFGSALSGKTLESGPYKIFNQAHLIQNNFALNRHFVSEETFSELKNYEVLPGDILFSMMGTIGKCRIMPFGYPQGIMDSHLLKARLNNKVLPEFFAYAYDKDASDLIMNQLLYLSNGTIMDGLNSSILKSVIMAIPPLDVQQMIINYLNGKCAKIDEAISRHQTIIEKLGEYKRATIVASVSGGLSSEDENDSDIKWMPKVPTSWNVFPLWVLFKERKNKNSNGAETNLLSLSYGKIKRKDIKTNEGLLPENFNGYNIIEDGDIVLRLTDLQNDMRSLRTGLVTEHGIITSAYITLKPVSKLNSAYYHYLLHAYDIMKVFYSMGEGVRQNLNYNELCKMLLPNPPIPEQDEIVEYLDDKCSKVDEAISRQKDAVAKLEEYRKSIIYNAVTGKIDCRIGE
ncbi:MAG: restriction endonuclease subunit S [Parabacteroides sp.]|nr:restriction endonuclease subunit S [Parabacteroides sp.]